MYSTFPVEPHCQHRLVALVLLLSTDNNGHCLLFSVSADFCKISLSLVTHLAGRSDNAATRPTVAYPV